MRWSCWAARRSTRRIESDHALLQSNATLKAFIAAFRKYMLAIAAFVQSWGLFAGFGVAFIDGMGLPLPGVVDAVVIGYSVGHPRLAWLCVLLTAIGSTLGCLVLYGIGYKGGQAFVEKKMSRKQFHRAHAFFERNRFLALMVPSMMPPPFPLKVFIFTAALFEVNITHFLGTVFFGRLVRFALFTFLAVKYGPRIAAGFGAHVRLILIVAGLIIALVLVLRAVRRRGRHIEALE
jgi:membrane protein DedA with SNARE-associated domain